MARADLAPAGPRPVQLRYQTDLTGEQYVNACGWAHARLAACPNHPHGGCSLSRHGTYGRKTPRGCRVARWYCRQSHTTFSLLPDCLAARLPGTLRRLEEVVAVAEAAPSLAAAALCLRGGEAVGLEGARRWVRRRVRRVHRDLHIARGLRPDLRGGCPARMIAGRGRVRSLIALVRLRGALAGQLSVLPWPLGFYPHGLGANERRGAVQHQLGPDPPERAA